ncbi:acyl-CoA dehydrogenase family protein [Sphingobium subterraneum]|uniref:3-hydroxy-9,10-secoandrosta-1,3,5(10)-triene-9, 17-dione monooxygenase n=1 Tax=Sphingobium subterraneum TaxID=627688 RepID=A0A841J399_9SPHN|nr:acyl-CoA dehydrogenase family protein [Sphingobium subterraneum]MBB6123085.1 3-hydroxy-9,10-secoandrosta-1,3,5(10)-triene-9,17-dione monooxygenase [Sphingobium subterraneum]
MVTLTESRPREAGVDAAVVAQRARGLIDQLRVHAAKAEDLRRVPDENMQLVRDAQLLRVVQAESLGGFGLGYRSHLDVVSAIAEGCTATGWVVGVGHVHSWMVCHMDERARQEVYGENPDALVAAVIAPRGKAVEQSDGSWLLNGVWPFASGCQHAQWLMLGAELTNKDGVAAGDGDILVRTSDVEIKDDWFVAGLQGTGSNSVAVKDLRVPAHRKLQLDAWLDRRSAAYDSPEAPAMLKGQSGPVLAIGICGAALGAARAALAEFRRTAVGKKVVYTPHISDEWVVNQVALGLAAGRIHAAELMLYSVADEIDAYADRDEDMPIELRGRIRVDCSLAVRFLLEAVDSLFMNGGASGLSTRSPIQRAARDIRAMNMHGLMLLETSAETYGRILLGHAPLTPIY